MAFNIGAIISVSGEKEYNQAMSSIRQNLKYVTAESKAVTSQFAANEKSVESLTAQNKVLDKALEEQKKAVSETEAALKRLTDAGVEPSAKAYRDMEANLNYAKAAVNETTREIRINSEAIREATEETDDFSKAQQDGTEKSGNHTKALGNLAQVFGVKIPDGVLESVGKLGVFDGAVDNSKEKSIGGFGSIVSAIGNIDPAALGAAGAIAGIGIAVAKMSVEAGLELDKLSAKMQVALGLTDEEAKYAQGSIERVYTLFADNRDEAEQSLTAVMRLMNASGQEAESYAGQLININRVFGDDFATTARTASTLMQTFGINGQEALDLITKGLQTSANKNGDLLDVLNEYSPSFARLGDDAETFLSRLIAGTDAGAFSADKAADVYKELFNKAADGNADFMAAIDGLGLSGERVTKQLLAGGDTAQRAMETLMGRLESVKDETKQNQIASKLLGSQWEDVGTKAPLAMAKVSGAIIETTGASAAAVEKMIGTTSAKWDAFWKGIKSNLDVLWKGGLWKSIELIGDVAQWSASGTIPKYASGTDFHPGGLALVGERGPELVNLRRGAQVFTNAETRSMLAASGGDTFYVTIDAKNVREFNDIVRYAKAARQDRRVRR